MSVKGWASSDLMTVNNCTLIFEIHKGIFSAGFQERIENGLRLMEIVVNDVDQEERIHDLRDELA